jgi:ABC-type uncharacterized transport system permease subunit
MNQLLFSLSALFALVPVWLAGLRPKDAPDGLYWATLAVALVGPLTWVIVQMAGAWRPDFSITLWVTVAGSMGVFILVAATTAQAWRLTPLIAPYLLLVGVLATVWYHASPPALHADAPTGWVHSHILVSVATYCLVTVAAVAALAAFLQERALKRKRPTAFTRRLPPLADCESLVVRLLVLGEVVLALGLATGMAVQYNETGSLLQFDHKIVLTVAAFFVIGGLLIAHYRSGVRGRMAARIVLLAYLLLTLGYPGVKFVTDVIMA